MRKVRELLRLKFDLGLSDRKIAASLGVARSTVSEGLRRAAAAGIAWPLPAEFDDAALEARLYPPKPVISEIPLPDLSQVERELARPGVTRRLLWQEYKAGHPEGLQYSAFCDHLRAFRSRALPVMRFEHRAGEKCFVDYAGQTVGIVDRHTGEIQEVQIFVAVLGCSNYTFAEASLTQSLPDWLGSHVRALEFFGGVPGAFVPDNLKSGVHKPHRYDPDLNRAYAEFAAHYGTAILPARVRKPRDKAKVETGVLIVERWILARLRNQTFFSLAELNTAIAELLTALNHQPFQKLEGSRRSRFLELDTPALKALPEKTYEYAQWKFAKVHPDYHIEVERAYYSVPYRSIGRRVEVRITARMIEIFAEQRLIAAHARLFRRSARSTLDAHRPHQHRAVIENTIERLLERAQAIGPAVAAVLKAQFQRKLHPEAALRSAQGILRLAADFSPQALNTACERALALQVFNYRSLRALIKTPAATTDDDCQLPLVHDNLRGPDYFH
jgi:transposase